MASYGLAYFLEDISGSFTPSPSSSTSSEFVDLYGRMRLLVRRTTPDRPVYMIFNTTTTTPSTASTSRSFGGGVGGGAGGAGLRPLVALDFGMEKNLNAGVVSFPQGTVVPMKKYLVKTSSKSRKFRASDGLEYSWTYRAQRDQEWACTNPSGHTVAYYSLKPHGEPVYARSSGCSLTIEEAYPHLAPEFLASFLIMRHIHANNL